jgi:hypothetical protein
LLIASRGLSAGTPPDDGPDVDSDDDNAVDEGASEERSMGGGVSMK